MMISSNASNTMYLITSSLGSYGNSPKTIHTESSTPPWQLVKNWGQLYVRCALRFILYLRGVKKYFIGNWVKVVVLFLLFTFIFFFIGPLRVILQGVPAATDIGHASMISLIFFFFFFGVLQCLLTHLITLSVRT